MKQDLLLLLSLSITGQGVTHRRHVQRAAAAASPLARVTSSRVYSGDLLFLRRRQSGELV